MREDTSAKAQEELRKAAERYNGSEESAKKVTEAAKKSA